MSSFQSENELRRRIIRELLGEHDPRERIKRLHALGLSRMIIATLTGYPQSHVSRVLDPSIYEQHLRYNMLWRRQWRKRRKLLPPPAATENTGDESSGL